MGSRQVQTEIDRKFIGSTGFGIYPLVTGVTDCVELGFV
jgi:hypothetical protein